MQSKIFLQFAAVRELILAEEMNLVTLLIVQIPTRKSNRLFLLSFLL
jgi:hypothetical protein